MTKEKYDRIYFEEGVSHEVSGYTNYTWQPEFTIPLAHRLIHRLNLRPGDRILEFGCAKGFLVYALRLLDIDAWGCDISEYAIENAHLGAKPYIKRFSGGLPYDTLVGFDWIIAKDVLEHLRPEELDIFLEEIKFHTSKLFFVVPLGDGKKYIVPQYEKDITHVIRWPLTRWVEVVRSHGWKVVNTTTDMTGLKDSWNHFIDGNAAVTLTLG